jgi:hypothetical protein
VIKVCHVHVMPFASLKPGFTLPAAQVRCFNTLELLLALTTLPQQLATLKVGETAQRNPLRYSRQVANVKIHTQHVCMQHDILVLELLLALTTLPQQLAALKVSSLAGLGWAGLG